MTIAVNLVRVYSNAQFLPNNITSKIIDLFSIDSSKACACECNANSQCLATTYFGFNQTCSLVSVRIDKQLLKLTPWIMNAIVYDFRNKSISSTMTTTTSTTTTTTTHCSYLYSTTVYSRSTGTKPSSVVASDINGDNISDIIVANALSDSVDVFVNYGNGTFMTAVSYNTGHGPSSIAVSDVNGDNASDIIVATSGSTSIDVILNIGNGTFYPRVSYGNMTTPLSVAVANLNADDKPDIIVTDNGETNVLIFFNAGNGIFLSQTTVSLGGTFRPFSIATADINDDNAIDFAVTDSNTGNVCVFINEGNGTFVKQATYTVSAGVISYAVVFADVNGDAKSDLITAHYTSSKIGVRFNIGNGTFTYFANYNLPGANGPYALAIADVNGDNFNDIIVAFYLSDKVSNFINAGNGTFPTAVSRSTIQGPVSVAVADLNGDNKPDIISANTDSNTISIIFHC